MSQSDLVAGAHVAAERLSASDEDRALHSPGISELAELTSHHTLAASCRYVMQTYARPDLVFVRGEGARLYDAHGKEYLDFAAGIAVNALGGSLAACSQ